MIADEQYTPTFIGNPDPMVLSTNATHHAIVDLVEQELPVWRDRPKRPPFQDEPKLNQSLCLHLDDAARHCGLDSLRFVQEGLQAGSRRTDICVMAYGTIIVEGRNYEDYVQLLPIECKRIPTPHDKRRSDCEYVHGLLGHRTGAIERFKHGLHGAANQHAMIIAYVQGESLKHWQTRINERLRKMTEDEADEGLWSPEELLSGVNAVENTAYQKLESVHRRRNPPASTTMLQIDHLWLLMN